MSLVRALDVRMVAQKITDTQKRLVQIDQKAFPKLASTIKEYYQQAFSVFVASDFEKAVLLWEKYALVQQELNLEKKRAVQKKDLASQGMLFQLEEILKNAYEISMLVR